MLNLNKKPTHNFLNNGRQNGAKSTAELRDAKPDRLFLDASKQSQMPSKENCGRDFREPFGNLQQKRRFLAKSSACCFITGVVGGCGAGRGGGEGRHMR